MTVRTYTCEGCGDTLTARHQDAFEKGWDTPERFGQHTTCPNCPITVTAWWRAINNEPLAKEDIDLLNTNIQLKDSTMEMED